MAPRRPSWLRVLLVALLLGSAATASALPLNLRLKQAVKNTGQKLKAKLRLDKLGIVVTTEAQIGYGTSIMGDAGFIITPKDEETHKRKVAAFTSLEVEAFGRGVRGTLATDKEFSGLEQKYWMVRTGSAIYGDRITLPVIPEVISIYAARSGGIGMRFTPFLLPLGLSFPTNQLARWGFTVYIQHPWLAKVANPTLAFYDYLNRKIAKPVRQAWNRNVGDPMTRAWKRFRGKLSNDPVAKPESALPESERLVLREPELDERT